VSARLPGSAVIAVLLIAALAGALLASWVVSDDAAPAVPKAARVLETPAPSQLQRALPAAVGELAKVRRAGRERLASARGPKVQAAAAQSIAADYHAMSKRLAGPAEKMGATVLLGAIDRADHAYQLLAKAARELDRPGYKVARIEIADAERQLPGAFADALRNAG
jgi:hypothetical protein